MLSWSSSASFDEKNWQCGMRGCGIDPVDMKNGVHCECNESNGSSTIGARGRLHRICGEGTIARHSCGLSLHRASIGIKMSAAIVMPIPARLISG
jgi:hypothetical protein